jgi:hypothetical protein
MGFVSRREAALQAEEASSSEGPYVVECPYCGARPGYSCRKEGTCDIIYYPHKVVWGRPIRGALHYAPHAVSAYIVGLYRVPLLAAAATAGGRSA